MANSGWPPREPDTRQTRAQEQQGRWCGHGCLGGKNGDIRSSVRKHALTRQETRALSQVSDRRSGCIVGVNDQGP